MEVDATDLARPVFQQAAGLLLSQLHQCSDYRGRLAHLTFYVNARNPCSSLMLTWQTLYQWAFSPTLQYDFYYTILIHLFYLFVTVDNFLLLNLQIKLYCWTVHKGNNPDTCRVWYVVVSGLYRGAWNRSLVDKEMTPFLIGQSKLVVLCGSGASFVIRFLRKSHEHFSLERVFPHFNHNPFPCQEWRFAASHLLNNLKHACQIYHKIIHKVQLYSS